jgi:hypothetical protein
MFSNVSVLVADSSRDVVMIFEAEVDTLSAVMACESHTSSPSQLLM